MRREENGRRDVSSRNTNWAEKTARTLTKYNITPNQISIMSVVFATIGCVMLLCTLPPLLFNKYIAFVIYIVCIQMRLLCNLFDGMVAIEGGKKTPNGDLFNDIPDRVADALFIVPVGYIAGGCGIELAWIAALLAIFTAYLRWIGAYKTQEHYFNGPMAKQHRMALLTITFVLAIVAIPFGYYSLVCFISLIILNIGLIITSIRRLYFISHSKKE